MNKNMKICRVRSVKNGATVADKCYVAVSFFDRLKGLIGTQAMAEGQGLLLRPCNDIHMWFMSVSLDVVFIHRESRSTAQEILKVTSVREGLRPWKLLPVRDGRAHDTLELPAGTIRRCSIQAGDELCIS